MAGITGSQESIRWMPKGGGISDNDLIQLWNDRGTVVCAAQVTERVRPGTVHSYESCAVYEPTGKPGESVDKGGCINTLTTSRMMVEKSHSMVGNSCLIEICRCDVGDGTSFFLQPEECRVEESVI